MENFREISGSFLETVRVGTFLVFSWKFPKKCASGYVPPLRIRFTPFFSFIAVPWIFLPTSKSFLSKYLQRKLFDGMIFHTMFDQLEMDEKNTVKKLSTFLTPNWSFELCQLPRLKKIEIVGANNVMWYTIQCRQPLF